jgi:hypothetical protein
MAISEDYHFMREDRTLHWERIAAHVKEHPQDLAIPLENIERWLAFGRVHPAPLLEWRQKIQEAQISPTALRELIEFLALPNHDAETLKSCSPFVGLPLPELSLPS